MPKFSTISETRLATCDARLVKVMREAIKYVDFTVVEGHRGKEAQNQAYAKGYSKLPWPLGNHNKSPSTAVDIAPFPVDWSDRQANLERFVYLAGVVLVVSTQLGIRIRWGGDWDQNRDMRDENFRDRPHFELAK